MARSGRFFSLLFLVLMLLVATETGVKVAEARTCESLSQRFRGVCLSATNCGNVCKNEGFYGGNCRGFRRRCFCTKHC